MDIYYLDGQFVPANEAVLPVHDLAVLRGYGVFDFLRSYNGVPFHLQDHLERLERSARLIGLNVPETRERLTEIVMETVARNSRDEFTIRIVLTGGDSHDHITPGTRPRLLVMVAGLKEMPASWYEQGAAIITSPMDRFVPGAKSTNYIPGILSLHEAAVRGAIEAVYTDHRGYLQEGTTSNFFGIFGETLVTPPGDRILPGITRQVLLGLARDHFQVEVRELHRDEIRLMDEAIITASNKEVVPVVRIDAVQLSGGMVGPQARRLMELFRDYTNSYRGD